MFGKLILCIFLLTSFSKAFADRFEEKIVKYNTCFVSASNHYKVDVKLLKAIAKTESSGSRYAYNVNSNGTADIGIMQINSGWLGTLNRYGITKTHLQDPCWNIHIGAWILASNISLYGNTWRAVGAYNARSKDKQILYVKKVMKSFSSLT
jgi:soluble lytic murein transglycosylase-like protein